MTTDSDADDGLTASVYGSEERGVGIEVVDRAGHTHVVLFDWDGNLVSHMHDRFPGEVDPGSTAERILDRVKRRARHELHRETDVDALPAVLDPDVLADAIEVLESLSPEAVADHFGALHRTLADPPVDPDREAVVVAAWLRLDDAREELRAVSEPTVLHADPDDAAASADGRSEYAVAADAWDHGEVDLDWEPHVQLALPATESVPSLESGFRALLVHHLVCRIRDHHYRQGRRPPERYRVVGPGIADDIVPFDEQEP